VSSPRTSVPDFVPFVAERLFRDQSSVDLGFKASDQIAIEQASNMVAWANTRPNGVHGETLVRAWTPDLPGVSYSVVEIVTDDMPFLVDSVTSELTREGRAIQLVAHPLFAVTRDEKHRLTAVHELDVNEIKKGMTAESWMRIHVERNFISDDLEELVAGVERVLGDVRKCVNDWSAMRTKAIEVSGDLRRVPPTGIDPAELEEAIALLEWLTQDSFTFIGYREYDLGEQGGEDILSPIPGSGLGVLRENADEAISKSFAILPPAVRAKAREKTVLVLSKANSRSTVHRPAYLDYVGVKKFDGQGNVVGERRFLGLFAARAYSDRIVDIPVLRAKYQKVERSLDFVSRSHSAKDLEEFLDTYPRDEVFQIDVDHLTQIAKSVLQLQERRQTKLYVRYDPYERFVSALVYFPRDRYTTAVRLRLESILRDAFGGISVDYTARVSESVLARLHYVIHMPSGVEILRPDLAELEARLTTASRSWMDEYQSVALAGGNSDLIPVYADAFPESYKEDFDPGIGINDALIIEKLEPGELALDLYAPVVSDSRELRFKVTQVGPAMPLTKILPILERLGVEVLDEHPYEISRNDRATAWILDFGLVLPKGEIYCAETLFARFELAFEAAWHGWIASDSFNALVTRAGLTWQDAKLIRAYARYMRQIGTSFGQGYIESVILENAEITRLLIEFFRVRFDPRFTGDRDSESDTAREQFEALLVLVPSLDHDRILRLFWSLIEATMRTNYFTGAQTLAFKLVPKMIADIPLPKPAHEIWVYSPRVEGVHLRFGVVARGGLRWSDRREDFRTEILGLVKAQEVKNAVIVPAGAKGGFFAKRLPDPSIDREAWMNEGIGAYQDFIKALLSLTDNVIDSVVVPPTNVVRHDLDDTYLVVAADKGTASFSDIANAIAIEENFWLGDAFASGGSAGYDHKSMAITARGAWESVKRHFFEMDINTQKQEFTVIGIGDMSGDVFGNGMLLSEHIRLIAAFDHRNIFIDPSPNAAVSFAERKRVADLPRSSWENYDTELISAGGGVFSRGAKNIVLSQEIKDVLDFNPDSGSCTPDQLINAILKAPAQLLWNGGIGTYVKASTETNVEVGDKANDAIRVNGGELRVQVVGEGGNLGMTQLGRVESARRGVRLNTDAIDNSAGVDTSDHEVNMKILLAPLVASGALTLDKRDELLRSMTDSVASLVLADNFNQNVVLSNARAGAVRLISVHQRMIRELERQELMNRALEYLPDDAEMETRRLAGEGLTSPELAVLLAYAKIEVTKELNTVGLGNDPWCDQIVIEYFPEEIRERYREEIKTHPLRSEIANTMMANELINIGGVTFVFRAVEETGANTVEVVKAAFAAMEVFGIRSLWRWINTLPEEVPASARTVLHLEVRRLLDRSARWFLQNRGAGIEVDSEISSFVNSVAQYAGGVPRALQGQESERFERLSQRFIDAGAPKDLADRAASGLDVFSLLDITRLADSLDADMTDVIGLYFALSERFDIDRLLVRISSLPRGDRWTSLARQALRSDLYSVIAELTGRVYRATQGGEVATRISQWEEQRTEGVARTRATLDEILQVEEVDLATLSVGLRVLRNLVAQAV
jgi:glutamate dehydrogenase